MSSQQTGSRKRSSKSGTSKTKPVSKKSTSKSKPRFESEVLNLILQMENADLGVFVRRGMMEGMGVGEWTTDDTRAVGEASKAYIRKNYQTLDDLITKNARVFVAPAQTVVGLCAAHVVLNP